MLRLIAILGLLVAGGSCDDSSGVPNVPVLGLSTTSATISLRAGSDSVTQSISLVSDAAPITWSASSGVTWLRVSPATGTTPSTVTITARSDGLAPGIHTGVVTVTAAGATSPVHFTVTLTVLAQPILVVATDTLFFSAIAGQTDVGTRLITITNGGTGVLSWTASATTPWITVAPSNGGNAGVLNVSASAASLTAGTFHGSVVVTDPAATNSPRTIPVKIVVTPSSFTINASANPAEGGSVTGEGSYTPGAIASLAATAANGFDFVSWTENGTVLSTSPNMSFAVTADRTLTANFGPVNFYSVTTSSNPAGAGTTHGSRSDVRKDSLITVWAIPNGGYDFLNWSEGGSVISTAQTYTFAVSRNHELVANFAVDTPKVTITTRVQPEGAGTVTGAGTYIIGSDITLTATPNPGFTFIEWRDQAGAVVGYQPTFKPGFSQESNVEFVAVFGPPYFVELDITSPTENSKHYGSMPVSVKIHSSSAITSAIADVDGRQIALPPYYSATVYAAYFNLAGLAQGQKKLVVTVTNTEGVTGSDSATFFYYAPPVLTVTAPQPNEVARPTINYAASCATEEPVLCLVTLMVKGTVIASGIDSISGVADLSAYKGSDVVLEFTARAGQQQSYPQSITVHVE